MSTERAGGRAIALLLNNPFVADSRSWKLATSLAAAGFDVTVVARSGDGLPDREVVDGFEVVRLDQPRPLRWLPMPSLPTAADGAPGASAVVPPAGGRGGALVRTARDGLGRLAQAARYLLLARRWADTIAGAVPGADIWQSEGLITLPVALALSRRLGGKVVYDVRDLSVDSGRLARLPGAWRVLLARRERTWARAADAVLTANRPYADEVRRRLGVAPTIVFNGPIVEEDPSPDLGAAPGGAAAPQGPLRVALGVEGSKGVVLCLGTVAPGRGAEQLIDAIADVPDAIVVFVGPGGTFRDELIARTEALAHAGRVVFLAAVAPADIPAVTADADVAAIVIQPTTLNHRLTTPTRLFDAMGAGVPVVASDLPGMREIVLDAGMGLLVDPSDRLAIARALREILGDPSTRSRLAASARAAARDRYGWHRQIAAVLDVYASLGVVPPSGLPATVGSPTIRDR